MFIFGPILTIFESCSIFGSSWGSIENWLEPKTKPPWGNLACQIREILSMNFQDFGGRAVLVLRNPYEAILSTHNFLYAGHHGKAPIENFSREGIFRKKIVCPI